jgi:glycosyltransferase involved in cell wall biosynthesis
VLGLKVAPARSILVPTAHDEPAIYLQLYRNLFAAPAGIAYNTDVERKFLTSQFDIHARTQETVGCGVDLPQHHAYPRDRRPDDGGERHAPPAGEDDAAGQPEAQDAGRSRSRLMERGAMFRRRHRIHGPFVLYGGRIDKGKGCEELIEYFSTYVQDGGDASLVLMGAKLMPLPDEPFINFAGMLSERERLQALEAATVVAVPSPYESLSLLALESFAVGTPILANARSDVLVDHCMRSNAGLYYADRDEFVECLKLLLVDERLRALMGRNGRDYVRRNYRWDVVLAKYERMIGRIKSG